MARKDDPAYTYMEFTLSTRLDPRLPGVREAIRYFNTYRAVYGMLFRLMWKDLTAPGADLSYDGRKTYVASFMAEHRLLKRTVNSLWNEVTGRMAAYMELKKTELLALGLKIQALGEKITSLTEKKDALKPKVVAREATKAERNTYRWVKKTLYYKKNKQNRLVQKYNRLAQQTEKGEYHLCFGTGKLFGAQFRLQENGFSSHAEWKRAFRQKRDANIFYLGSRDENYGNQLFRVEALPDGSFQAWVRKEYRYCASNKEKDKYLWTGRFHIPYMGEGFRAAVAANARSPLGGSRAACTPLSFRVHFEGKKCYLQVILPLGRRRGQYVTRMDNGAIGLDFNDGFIEMAETDARGNLASIGHIPLGYHGQGKKGETELQEAIARISRTAAAKGKDLVSEDLSFLKKKAKTLPAKTKKGKAYNRMLHTLDYARYGDALGSRTFRDGVCWAQVSPAYTSKIGKQKFAGRMKLSAHQAAAYVIARRAQGFKDKYQKKKKKPSTAA